MNHNHQQDTLDYAFQEGYTGTKSNSEFIRVFIQAIKTIHDPSHFFGVFFCSDAQQEFFKSIAPSYGFNVMKFYAAKPARGQNFQKPHLISAMEFGVVLYPKTMNDFSKVKYEKKPSNTFSLNAFGGKESWYSGHQIFKYIKNPHIFGHFIARYAYDKPQKLKIVELFAGSASTFQFASANEIKMDFVEKDAQQTDQWKDLLENPLITLTDIEKTGKLMGKTYPNPNSEDENEEEAGGVDQEASYHVEEDQSDQEPIEVQNAQSADTENIIGEPFPQPIPASSSRQSPRIIPRGKIVVLIISAFKGAGGTDRPNGKRKKDKEKKDLGF
jgi:hypothetical protein